MPSNTITKYLKLMVEKNASDLFFTAGAPVNSKIEGITTPIGSTPLSDNEIEEIIASIITEEQALEFKQDMELDFAMAIEGTGRFRVNLFRQRSDPVIVIRYIRSKIPSIEELNLPPILKDLIMAPRGLILVVGTTGCGKSTTLASMIDYRNQNKTGHILTIEDPIEYWHEHQKSIVNQREVGIDTHSYDAALRRAMREAPDVILIGEIRDRETIEQAISYADTGHLCLSTLHATNANQTLERIINFFPETAHAQIHMDLALNLKAVVAQRLIQGVDGMRVPAVEILLSSPYVKELIQKHNIDNIRSAMEQDATNGMQTFDQSLYNLYTEKKISLEEALYNADSRNNLQLKIRLDEGSLPSGLETQ